MSIFDTNTTAQLERIAGQRAAMIARLMLWSSVNSGSGNLPGLSIMRGMISAAFAELGFPVLGKAANPATNFDAQGNLITRDYGENLHVVKPGFFRRKVVLTGHMDTVFPANSAFQTPILTDDDTMHGPGVADMKGGLIVMLEALRAFEASEFAADLGWEIIINSDEEVGSLGSAALLAEVGARCPVGMIFEPSATPDGDLAGARKGSGNFAARIEGRAAHAGRNPQDGRNAIIAAADLALRLDNLRSDYAELSVNVARIDGGSPNNVVPDMAVLRWNMRVKDNAMQHAIENRIHGVMTEIAALHDVVITQSGGFYRPPKPMTARAEMLYSVVADSGRDLGLAIQWHDTGGVCDGNNLAAMGVAVVDTLGVRGGNIHSDQEYVILDSLTERAQLAFLTLTRLARHEELFA